MDSCWKCGDPDPKQLVRRGEEIICKDCRTKRHVKENDNIRREEDNKSNIPFNKSFFLALIGLAVYYKDELITLIGV